MSDKVIDAENNLVLQPTADGGKIAISRNMLDALSRAGVSMEAVSVPDVPVYNPVELLALCRDPSSYKDAVGQSPMMVVVARTDFPDADDFDGYLGFFRCEAVTEDGDMIAWTSHMIVRDTGERGHLYSYVCDAKVPFMMRIVCVKTRKEGNRLYRPAPIGI